MLVDVQLSSLIPSASVLSLFWMENDDSKIIVKQNMLILVLSNFVMFNWMKNDDLERSNPNVIKSIHKKPLFGNQIIGIPNNSFRNKRSN